MRNISHRFIPNELTWAVWNGNFQSERIFNDSRHLRSSQALFRFIKHHLTPRSSRDATGGIPKENKCCISSLKKRTNTLTDISRNILVKRFSKEVKHTIK